MKPKKKPAIPVGAEPFDSDFVVRVDSNADVSPNNSSLAGLIEGGGGRSTGGDSGVSSEALLLYDWRLSRRERRNRGILTLSSLRFPFWSRTAVDGAAEPSSIILALWSIVWDGFDRKFLER